MRISVNVNFTVNCISPTPGATLFVKSPYNPLPNLGRGVVGCTIDRCIKAAHSKKPKRWLVLSRILVPSTKALARRRPKSMPRPLTLQFGSN